MALGNDNTICATEFVEAMRTRLNALTPPAGSNVDNPTVRPNLEALGQAVFRILTVEARTFSDATADPSFWNWIAAVNTWLGRLSAWQSGVATAFSAYAPVTAAEQSLRSAIVAVPAPGPAPAAAPSNLTGVVK